jgi:hypothetical protein
MKQIILVLFVVLAGCSNAPRPDQNAIDAATEAYAKCAVNAAYRFDDQRSDATTIAKAVEGACADEWNAEIALREVGMPPEEKYLFAQDVVADGEQDEETIPAVLYERNNPPMPK